MNEASKSQRSVLIIVAAFCLAFAGIYAALWSAGAAAMRKTIGAISENARGADVSFGGVRTKGFPFFLRGELRTVSVRGGGVVWRSPNVAIDALPIKPNRFIFTSANPQTVDLARLGAYEIRTVGARASLAPRKGDISVDAQADHVAARAMRGDIGLDASGVLFKAAPVEGDGPGVHASLFVGAFEVAKAGRTAKGEKLLIDVVASGARGAPTADIKRFALEANGASVELKGAVTVDSAGYPSGVLDAVVRNPKGLAIVLSELGALSDEDAREAGAALRLAAFATGGEIRAPIEFKDGAARIVGVKIAALPKLK